MTEMAPAKRQRTSVKMTVHVREEEKLYSSDSTQFKEKRTNLYMVHKFRVKKSTLIYAPFVFMIKECQNTA